jgi:glycosyltransferase involved in cell wall biosynthesis
VRRRPVLRFARFCDNYGLPARNRNQRRARPARVSRRRLQAAGRRTDELRASGRRRLAYLDSTFPWKMSGFRYREALALLEARPDTLFFSQYELTDPFPAPVLPLSQFPVVAPREGVTDAYAVFELFLAGLCGAPLGLTMRNHPMAGPRLSHVFRDARIRLHGGIYAGGGMTLTPDGLERTRAVVARLDTALSYLPELLERIPEIQPVPQAMCDVDFHALTHERWAQRRPVRCLFAADGAKRKGFSVVVDAFRDLDPEQFQLDVVGPNEHRRPELPPELARFHGWLSPERLRDLHRDAHIFVSPVSRGDDGVTDGFPTVAATDAMSSGCLLVSANPPDDRRYLAAGVHYVECPAEPAALTAALLDLAAEPDTMQRIAYAGAQRVRETMDVRIGLAQKLEIMGL